MKRLIAFLFFIIITKINYAQTNLPRSHDDTLFTSNGYKIVVGQEVKLGIGTKDNGDFKFITTAKTLLSLPNQRLPSMRKTSNGHSATVRKIKTEGNSRNGYVFYITLSIGEPMNYDCDVESAIASGELVVPDQFKNASTTKATSTTPPISVADEIAKLKKLYDDSVITKEEFEAQKKKLLGENQ